MISTTDYLDLTSEAKRDAPACSVDNGNTWDSDSFDPVRCTVVVDTQAREEALRIVEDMRRRPLPTLLRSPDEFEMPRLREVMHQVRERLTTGPGVGVVDSLPLDDIDKDEAVALYWILGQLVGRPVAQTWNGVMLYDVTDKGKPLSYGIRASRTRSRLVFHTDNASGAALPDTVGLLCLRQAIKGGESRFCNLTALHDRLLAEHPRELKRLYQPLLYDRQAEHVPGEPKVSYASMFSIDGDRLRVRANLDLVRQAYELVGETVDEETAHALATVKRVTMDPSFWATMPLARGQMQFLNNRRIAHYRSEYEDSDDPELKRHLVRTWYREVGRATFDG